MTESRAYTELRQENERLRLLVARAADVLERYAQYPVDMVMSVSLREQAREILPQLREAAK